jgi:hypothetical protein
MASGRRHLHRGPVALGLGLVVTGYGIQYLWPTPEGWPSPDPRRPGYFGPTFKSIRRPADLHFPTKEEFENPTPSSQHMETIIWESFGLLLSGFSQWVWGHAMKHERDSFPGYERLPILRNPDYRPNFQTKETP